MKRNFNVITIIEAEAHAIWVFDFLHHESIDIHEYETRYVGNDEVRVLGYFTDSEWDEDRDEEMLSFVQEHIVGAPIEGPGEYHYSQDQEGNEHRYTMLVTEEDPFSSKAWPETTDPYSWIQVEGHLQVAFNLIL